jgi:hypothetical protein
MGSEYPLHTEFDFILPGGLIDAQGGSSSSGGYASGNGKDEISVQKDRRVKDDPAYGVLVMLSRVITRLGSLSSVTPEVLEGLFTRDLAYLREFYNRLNQQGDAYIPVQCPQCSTQFSVELSLSGES